MMYKIRMTGQLETNKTAQTHILNLVSSDWDIYGTRQIFVHDDDIYRLKQCYHIIRFDQKQRWAINESAAIYSRDGHMKVNRCEIKAAKVSGKEGW